MSGLGAFWSTTDTVGRAVALVLLAMSVGAWVVILWKAWVLRRAAADLRLAIPAYWQSSSAEEARSRVAALDREQLLRPLIDAAEATAPAGTLAAAAHGSAQLTRRLRDALHQVLAHLQFGQVLLASVGATAPFVGLFGTVWGIYHALSGIAASGSLRIDQVSGPVGEALVMTAAGLAVAIPAVLAYNLYGKWIAAAEAELEGFAHDLREWLAGPDAAPRD